MIDVNVSAYAHPILGAPGAYIPPHDTFELRDCKFARPTGNGLLVSGTLDMRCGLLERYIKSGACRPYMLIWNPGKVYRECTPVCVGDFTVNLDNAGVYADACKMQCVVVADMDIPQFFHKKYHNPEYGGIQFAVKRGTPLAVSGMARAKKKVNSVGSAFKVEIDDKLDEHISFVIQCGEDDDYIHIKARRDTKTNIENMLKTDRPLFDNAVLAPVLAHALQRMDECKDSAQWARVLAEKCDSMGITSDDICESLHKSTQKLLYMNSTSIFERLKWNERSRRTTETLDGDGYS